MSKHASATRPDPAVSRPTDPFEPGSPHDECGIEPVTRHGIGIGVGIVRHGAGELVVTFVDTGAIDSSVRGPVRFAGPAGPAAELAAVEGADTVTEILGAADERDALADDP